MTAEQQSYQERVAALLERIDAYSRKRLRLETAGARRPLLAPLDEKLELLRAKLAALVESRGREAQGSSPASAATYRSADLSTRSFAFSSTTLSHHAP